MKKIFSVIFFSVTVVVKAQVWVPATPFPGASGYINGCTNNNQTYINSMCVFNNELYVGGNFSAIGGIVAHGIAKWNGNTWSSVGAGNFIQTGCVSDIIVYNSNLYFTADKLYKWNGSSIQDFTYFNTATQTTQTVFGTDLHVFNGELYISIGGSKILKYNGSAFSEIIFDYNLIGSVRCIDNLNNSLYVGSDKGLFNYQNGNWSECNGITTDVPDVFDIEPYNNELYVLGAFNSIGGLSVNNFVKYNGSSWENVSFPNGFFPITNLLSGWTMGTNHLRTMNNELYLAHTLASNQQQSPIFSPLTKFNGSQWVQISQNNSIGGGCSAIYNNELYCGGKIGVFQSGVVLGNIVKLQGSAGFDEIENQRIQISPNPTKDIISIKGEKNINQPFSIFDQMGCEVFKGKLTGTETEVNLSSLSKGMYTLKIEGNYQPAQIVKE